MNYTPPRCVERSKCGVVNGARLHGTMDTYELASDMQIDLEKALMFDRYRMWYRHALVWMKACGGNLVDKPQPMQEEDIKACAESALSGSVTMMYARVAVFLKSLHGCRNPVFTAWQWKHIEFVPTVLYKDGEPNGEV